MNIIHNKTSRGISPNGEWSEINYTGVTSRRPTKFIFRHHVVTLWTQLLESLLYEVMFFSKSSGAVEAAIFK